MDAAAHLRQLIGSWRAYWFQEVPPHSAALLRMVFGLMVLLGLIGETPVDTYWTLDGLSPLPDDSSGPRAWLMSHGLGVVAGRLFFVASVVVATAVMLGLWSDAAVALTLVAMWVQLHWNRLPLSAAHQVVFVILFSLVWTNTGKVWSLDARRRAKQGGDIGKVAIWPLRVMRCQIALIYFSSALSKMLFPMWRDGSASHWSLSLNGFHRFPWPLPPAIDPVMPFFTWGTLAFEFLFPVLVWFRLTRGVALLMGIGLHLGLFVTLELGPFSFAMIASYLAFLDPETVARFDRRTVRSLRRNV